MNNTSEEIWDKYPTKLERLITDFKDLTGHEDMIISSDIMDYLFYVYKNIDKFKTMFSEKYINKSFDDAMFEYYLQYVEKSEQIRKWLDNIGVVADAKAFMEYFWKKIQLFFAINPYTVEMTEKVKILTNTYTFIEEVKIIKDFLKRYGGLANIPEEHNRRIITKIESLVYHI